MLWVEGSSPLQASAVGEIELEGHALVIKRIAVTYRLAVDQNADHAAIERVHGLHAECCPLARSIDRRIDTTTQVEYITTE